MNIGISGITHFGFGNQTIIGAIGKKLQTYSIPDDIAFSNVVIDNGIVEKVSLTDRTITINGSVLITVDFEPRTGYLTILSAGPMDFGRLAANAKIDPKAQSFSEKLNNILNQLPESGHVAHFIENIFLIPWMDMFAEFMNGARKAYPQEWAKIEEGLPKEFSDWLASKLKI